MRPPDSAQIAATLGFAGGVTLSDVSALAATACACIGIAYTAWKWHREAKHPPHPPTR